MSDNPRLTRRAFLQSAAAAAALAFTPFSSDTSAAPKDVPLVKIMDKTYTPSVLGDHIPGLGKVAVSPDGHVYYVQHSKTGHSIGELVNGAPVPRFKGAPYGSMHRTEIAVDGNHVYVHQSPIRDDKHVQGVTRYDRETGRELGKINWRRAFYADWARDMAVHPNGEEVHIISFAKSPRSFRRKGKAGFSAYRHSTQDKCYLELVCFDTDGNQYVAIGHEDIELYASNQQGGYDKANFKFPFKTKGGHLFWSKHMAFDAVSGNIIVGTSSIDHEGKSKRLEEYVFAMNLKNNELIPIARLTDHRYMIHGIDVDSQGNIYLSAFIWRDLSDNSMIIKLNRTT